MQPHYVWKVIRTVAARANIVLADDTNVSPHTLRRSLATELLNRGVRLETVSRLLGHANTAVTEKYYAHLSDARLRIEVEAAFGIRSMSAPSPESQPPLDRDQLAGLLHHLSRAAEIASGTSQ